MPKRFNSNKKGNAREHEAVKDLTTRFGKIFSRSVASGASATKKNHNFTENKKHFIEKNTGDIITPDTFRFVIEVKHYKAFDFFTFWPNNSLIDHWFRQAKNDAARVNKTPLLLFKFNYKKKMAALDYDFKKTLLKNNVKFISVNNEYVIFTQKDLFNFPDTFFFI